MADTKRGRVKKAHDAERRQREHELEEALEHGDVPEPEPEPDTELDGLDGALESFTYPLRTADLLEAEGERTVASNAGRATVATLLDPVDDESYGSPADVRARLGEQLDQQ